MADSNKKLTAEQQQIAGEFARTYDLSPEQINFEGDRLEPIFDFETLSYLLNRLATVKEIDCTTIDYFKENGEASCECHLTLADGVVAKVSNYAQLGELYPDGTKVENRRQCESLARARALRTAIRTAGVNILRAHRQFLATGEIGKPEAVDPRALLRREVHALAGEVGLIAGKDKREYQHFLAEQFDGRESSVDLDDNELRRLAVTLRAMKRVQNSKPVPDGVAPTAWQTA